MKIFEYKTILDEKLIKTYKYQFKNGYLQVNDKQLKIKELKNSDLIYRLNKTCITTKSAEYLENFIEEHIKENFATCWVSQIFEHILKVGE
jgi:hypothetical protein